MTIFDAIVCNGYAKEKLILQFSHAATSLCGSRAGALAALPILASRLQVPSRNPWEL
jgi:hypothetical protein